MTPCDTLIDARWCVPVEPAGAVLEHHSIAITDGRIEAVLPTSEAHQQYSPGAHLTRSEHMVFPGFVNTHTHAAMTLLRGFADDLALERWLREAIWPTEHRFVSTEMVRDGTRHALAEMLQSGVTCFSDQYFFPETVAETAQEMHVRAVVATPVLDPPTPWASSGKECLSKAADIVHDAYADHPLIRTAFAPHSTAIVSDETFRELRILADQLDVGIQIHLHESAAEVAEAISNTGKRPVARLAELGLINASLLAVHAVHLNDEEVVQLSDAGVAISHCPHSNLKLASGMARIAHMRAAGLTVSLGTDGAASNNALDMLAELRTAALLAKAVAKDAEVLDAHTALRMATLDGATALGLADEIGTLQPGKAADITCADLSSLRTQPVHNPVSQLIYACSAAQISDVWIAGRHQLSEHQLVGIDAEEILARSGEWQQRISGSTSIAAQ